MIYHITSRQAWLAARERGWYSAPTLASEGFIHCSKRDQVLQVANDFYGGSANLLLLCIDESRLKAELRWEAPSHSNSDVATATSSTGTFPHLYGRLNLDAVVRAVEFRNSDDGFALPADLP